MFLEYLLLHYYTIKSTVAPATTTTTEYDPLLLPLVLLVQQRMSPHIYQVLDSPLLCHDHPTTSLLKEGPGLCQLHLMQPQACPSLILSRKHDWGWETVESTLHPATRHCNIWVVRALLKVALSPIYLSPASGTTANPPMSLMRIQPARTIQSPVN